MSSPTPGGAGKGTASAGDIRVRVTTLVEERLGVDVPASDTDLLEAGLLDSLGLVTLIVGLEDTFACELPLDDFDIDRFRSVDAIAAFLVEAGVPVS